MKRLDTVPLAANLASQDDETRGTIFDVQRFSIHDGPGIRTTVFLKGCPLRCRWCHNPESMSVRPLVSFVAERCIGCGYCFRRCPRGAHVMRDGRHELDRAACAACGSCTEECYAGALERIGRTATVGEALAEVLRDKPFYETSGGGLTVSGGEPLAQIEFTAALLRRAKAEALHTCVETSGFADYACFERIRPLVDLFLYDIKEMNPAHHQEWTGVPNDRILANLERLVGSGAAVRLRLPLIPGYNTRADHFAAVAALVQRLPGRVEADVLPYHRLGESKVGRMGLEAAGRAQTEMPAKEQLAEWIRRLVELGVPVASDRH